MADPLCSGDPAIKNPPARRRNIVLVVVVLILASLLWLGLSLWRSPPYYRLMTKRELKAPILTMREYGQLAKEHPRPFVVEIESARGALLLYGATHTKDPGNPQIADLTERWNQFRPTVALVEGRLGFLIPGLMDPVKKFGEAGAVAALARAAGVFVYTWEPPRDAEVSHMLEEFPSKQVALFYVLRPYFSNFRHGKPADPDAVARENLKTRLQYPGLAGEIRDVAEIDEIWKRDFPGLPDWRDTSDEYGLPGYLNELAAESNAYRDEHFAQVILELVSQGHRVFAVAGSSHAVKLERALRATIK